MEPGEIKRIKISATTQWLNMLFVNMLFIQITFNHFMVTDEDYSRPTGFADGYFYLTLQVLLYLMNSYHQKFRCVCPA